MTHPSERRRHSVRGSDAFLAAMTLGVAACGGGLTPTPAPSPAPTNRPATTTTSTPATPAATAATRFAYTVGTASYDVRTESSVELTSGPETERGKESITAAGQVTYAVTPNARGVAVAGEVQGFASQASARVNGGPADPPATVRFRGTVDARGVAVDRDGASSGCTTPMGAAEAAAITVARETIIGVPNPIAVGARWRDSSVVATCRSQLPATVTTVARYEITSIDGNRVKVRRQGTTSVRGQGIAGGRSVSLSGAGTDEITYEMDAERGRLVRGDGDSRSTITVSLPDGARQFTQRTTLAVRLRP